VPLQGSLEEAALPDVVQLLSLGRKTGCLALTNGTLRGEIFLDQGRICYALVYHRRDRLGDLLVRSGKITREQLDEAIAQHQSGAHRVSKLLVESGQVEKAELERFVRIQVEESVYFMFTWHNGSFTFTSNVRPEHQDFLVSIDPEGLLLEGARRVDEWSVIEKKIPSFDLVFRIDRARLQGAAASLSEEQRRLAPLLDGTRDVAALVDATGYSEFEVGKALYGFITAGFASLVERRTAIRHLDYRELLAYSVREAEFADAERRRAAARHIADCATCSARLKTIHVRRTGSLSAVPHPEPTPVAAERTAVTAPPQPPATERRAAPERRRTERRVGERRGAPVGDWVGRGHVERRSGTDRRRAVRRTPPWASLDGGGGVAVAAAPAAPAVRRAMPDRRTTGPRRAPRAEPERVTPATKRLATPPVTTGETTEVRPAVQVPPPPAAPSTPVQKAPAAAFSGETTEVRPAVQPTPPAAPEAPTAKNQPAAKPKVVPASVSSLETTEVRPAVKPAPPSEVTAPRPLAPRAPRAEPRSPGPTTRDINWLVSPDEADRLVRTSWTELHGKGRRTPKPAPPASQAAAPPAPAPVAAPAPPPAPAAPSAADVPRPEPRPVAAPRAEEPSAPKARRTPWLAAAAAVIVMAGAALGVKAIIGGGGSPRVERVAESPPPPPPAQTQAAEQAAGGQVREQPAPTTATPAPTREVGVPPAPVATAPQREPAPVVAEAPARVPARDSVTPAAPPRVEPAPPAPAPAAATVHGTVRAAGSGIPLAGVQVTIAGTTRSATTDAAGVFSIGDVPAGAAALEVTMGGRRLDRRDVAATAGGAVTADFTVSAPVTAAQADEELTGGDWTVAEVAPAAEQLGGAVAVIPGLWVESVAVPAAGSRRRVRVAQLTTAGDRIVLTQTRSAAPGAGGTPRVTALRVIGPTEAYPVTTGTASFGSLLVTAKTNLSADSLRTLLATLSAFPARTP
jgi:hypothetical protein